MDRLQRKIQELILESDPEEKKRSWQKFVRKYIGCQCCQHYDKKNNQCLNGHQTDLEKRQGMPCEGIMPTELK